MGRAIRHTRSEHSIGAPSQPLPLRDAIVAVRRDLEKLLAGLPLDEAELFAPEVHGRGLNIGSGTDDGGWREEDQVGLVMRRRRAPLGGRRPLDSTEQPLAKVDDQVRAAAVGLREECFLT